eukprot:1091548-Ditylum_brightwellii.AAC.1
MHFDLIEPVDTIFMEIDDLADIVDLAKDPIRSYRSYTKNSSGFPMNPLPKINPLGSELKMG